MLYRHTGNDEESWVVKANTGKKYLAIMRFELATWTADFARLKRQSVASATVPQGVEKIPLPTTIENA